MRPTRRGLFAIAATVPVALLLGIVHASLWPLALALVVAILVLMARDAWLAPRPAAMDVTVRLPAEIFIGRPEAALVIVRTPVAAGPLVTDIACDTNALLRQPDILTAILQPDAENTVAIPLEPVRRGTAEVRRVWLRWTGPLGLMYRLRARRVFAEIPVIPNIRAVRDAALLFTAREGLPGSRTDAGSGQGTAFHALREWVPGIDPRAIDWKHSARHRALLAKEFEVERDHQIVLAIDTGHLMSEPLGGVPRLDFAINAGLLLAFMSLRGGDRVGLFGFDSKVRRTLEPVSGLRAFAHLQRAAAELDYNAEETNFTLGLTVLSQRLRHRSLIVVITEFVDTVTAELMVEKLSRVARRHLVLFVTFRDAEMEEIAEAEPVSATDVARAAIAHDFLRDRRVVLERLRRLGILCLESPGQVIGPALVNRYLAIKRQEMI